MINGQYGDPTYRLNLAFPNYTNDNVLPHQDSPDRSQDAPETDKDASADASAEASAELADASTSKETPAASTVPEQQQPVVKPEAPEQPSERPEQAREPEGESGAGKEEKKIKEASRTPSPAKPQSSKVYFL